MRRPVETTLRRTHSDWANNNDTVNKNNNIITCILNEWGAYQIYCMNMFMFMFMYGTCISNQSIYTNIYKFNKTFYNGWLVLTTRIIFTCIFELSKEHI